MTAGTPQKLRNLAALSSPTQPPRQRGQFLGHGVDTAVVQVKLSGDFGFSGVGWGSQSCRCPASTSSASCDSDATRLEGKYRVATCRNDASGSRPILRRNYLREWLSSLQRFARPRTLEVTKPAGSERHPLTQQRDRTDIRKTQI